MGYPDFAEQVSILKDRHTDNPLDHVQAVTTREELLEMKRECTAIYVADPVYEYVTRLAQATREHPMITLGISPRGALAVCRLAKSYAYMAGRDYVVPEDVAAIFPDVCAHRLVMSPKARMSQTSAGDVLRELLAKTAMPYGGTSCGKPE